jgi:hypothetical protein
MWTTLTVLLTGGFVASFRLRIGYAGANGASPAAS